MTKEERLKAIDHILKLPREKRWRAAMSLYLKMNPVGTLEDGQPITAKAHYMLVCKDNEERRQTLRNELAKNESGSQYLALSIPTDIADVIQAFDPQLNLHEDNRPRDTKKFMREFPEFTLPKKGLA